MLSEASPIAIPSAAEQEASWERTRQYLEDMRRFSPSSAGALVLEHGRPWRFDATAFAGEPGRPKQCYRNAGLTVIGSPDPGLVYVEGYVDIGIPIAHAWVVDSLGRVIEPTLRTGDVFGYFGIPFRRDYLCKVILTTKVWGLIGWNNRGLNERLPGPEPERFLEKGAWSGSGKWMH